MAESPVWRVIQWYGAEPQYEVMERVQRVFPLEAPKGRGDVKIHINGEELGKGGGGLIYLLFKNKFIIFNYLELNGWGLN